MHGRAAAHQMHRTDAAQHLIGELRDAQVRHAVLHAGTDRSRDGRRLLVDLLEHEVRVAALFGCLHIPVRRQHRALHRLGKFIVEADALGRAHGHVALFQHAVATGILEQGRDIRRYEVFALAPAHDERAFALDCKDGVRAVPEQHSQRIAAPHLGQCFLQRPQRVAGVAAVDELDQHLGVGFALKGIAFGNQTFLEDAVIFNDAVVHDAHPRGGMRVAVHVAGLTVGSPPGVPNAAEALCQSLCGQFLAQLCQPPLALYHADAAVQSQRNPRRIVPAVLQFFQTVQQHILCAALADITNNATHTKHLHAGVPPRRKNAQPGPSASLSVYVLVWLSLKGSVAVSLPFFALLCGWSSLQPEKHPPKFSMIPLLVTLAAVTRVARRFASTGGFAFPLSAAPVGCWWLSIPHFPILCNCCATIVLSACPASGAAWAATPTGTA